MVTNPAALRRATVIEVAAGAFAVVSVQPRVKLHMPLFVVHPVMPFLRYRAYTQQHGDHADYRYPPFGGHRDQFGGRDRARLRLYPSPFSALFVCRPGASRAMTRAHLVRFLVVLPRPRPVHLRQIFALWVPVGPASLQISR